MELIITINFPTGLRMIKLDNLWLSQALTFFSKEINHTCVSSLMVEMNNIKILL